MKEGLIASFLIIVVATAGYYTYDNYHKTEEYYTKVVTEGQPITLKREDGETFNRFRYQLESYKSPSVSKKVEIDSVENQPFKKDTYLKVKFSQEEGVTSLEEIKDVPSDIKNELDRL
ncbi:YxeA family protein [Vagococcus carniphilus]|uniref:YxeA family protein n=1 Tax=Vagococcus carniphilus TaxID=218144 RepID=UPI00288C7764|nr:YxeA family protein [Vagococcus carniphilus]MDT2813696.1 YxeA family protein [Vagococcus carniphilus]